MAAGEQRDQDLAHHVVLADDGLAQLRLDVRRALDEIFDRRVVDFASDPFDVDVGHWPSRSAKYWRTSSRTFGGTDAWST